MTKLYSNLLYLLVVLTGCWNQSDYKVICAKFEDMDEPFNCRIVVPNDLSGKVPLVIAYHGVGDTPESMANYSKLDQLAAKHRFLLVYPDAKGRLWRVPRSDDPGHGESRDLDRFDLILREIESHYAIDPKQIYVVGMSQGATFVHGLIRNRPNLVAAVVAHSGTPSKGTDFSKGMTPILLIAGQNDLVHDAMEAAAQEYHDADTASEFVSVPGLGHEWSIDHNEAIWTFLSGIRR
ncbi:alpha/beta hydrolase family esterase [Bremerella alba]|uniref:Phospholipase/carboxylesterase/thioesterase domain-containing protein n=1 Tax=Bremerella alba TaxID=980252 RepID=A0A7V8V637_9BACT|nr:PHB depolymerase family esterase [Bremerella alba]MBA2115654.1 hypothetical protein [Bremerella alba]